MSNKTLEAVHGILCANEDSLFRYFAWPSVERLPDGRLAAVASGFRFAHVCPFGKVVMCTSADEGLTWSAPAIVMDTPLDDRDAGLTVFQKNSVFLTSFNNTRAFQRSAAEHMWDQKLNAKQMAFINAYLDLVTDEQEVKYLGSTYRISRDGGTTWGEIRHIGITAPHGPARTPDGGLLYVGRRHIAKGPESWDILAMASQDGEHWEELGTIPPIPDDEHGKLFPVEPHCIVLPDGKIIVHIRVQRGEPFAFAIYQSVSTDSGRSFSVPVRLCDHGSPPHLYRHSSGVLISTYGYRTTGFGQRVMLSYDNGESWDTDFIIRDDGVDFDLGYPATIERKDGSLLTVYYQKPAQGQPCQIMYSIWQLPRK